MKCQRRLDSRPQSIIENWIARGLSVMRRPLWNEHPSAKTKWHFRRNENGIACHTRRNKRHIMRLLWSSYKFSFPFPRLTPLKRHGLMTKGEEIRESQKLTMVKDRNIRNWTQIPLDYPGQNMAHPQWTLRLQEQVWSPREHFMIINKFFHV